MVVLEKYKYVEKYDNVLENILSLKGKIRNDSTQICTNTKLRPLKTATKHFDSICTNVQENT